MTDVLLDTNVLIYYHDALSPEKQSQAKLVLQHLTENKNGCVSAQNLAEFVSVALRRLKPPLTPAEALAEVSLLSATLRVIDLNRNIVLEAARGVRDYQLSYYDAQIWAAARLNQIPVIFSEDFQNGQMIETVRFANPFGLNFNINEWL
ncbi:MAG: PIN domain-containing protein [Chloroflexota bacterium]